jgi:hypothetical protein
MVGTLRFAHPAAEETHRFAMPLRGEVAAHQIFATIARFSFAMRTSSRL